MTRVLKKYFPVFVLPTLISFALIFLVPFVLGIGLSFTRFTTVENASFVGLQNYREIFSSGDTFFRSVGFAALFSFSCIVAVNLIAFALALLLVRGIRGSNFFRSVFFMPNLIGGIVLGYVFNLLIGGVLSGFGVDITYKASYGFFGLVLLSSWQLIGYMMIIYIAALINVPKDVLEAAQIDGASAGQTLLHIKLPLILPSVAISVFLTLTNTFKMFDQNLALTGGAPEGLTELPALNIYNTFYGRVGAQGVGQAKAVLFFLIVSTLALIQLRLTQGKED